MWFGWMGEKIRFQNGFNLKHGLLKKITFLTAHLVVQVK